jgi:uroporphyrinogen-III decarboxylase
MNHRERVLAVLKGEKADMVPWFGDLDYYTTALIAQDKRAADFKESDEYLAWHRALRVGFYLQGYFPYREIIENCDVREWKDGKRRYREIRTPKGTLTECWLWSDLTYSEAPIERLLKTPADLDPYAFLYANTRYEPDYGLAEKRKRQVGGMGVVLCYLPRTPFMRMVAIDSGIENVALIYADAPEAFTRMFAAVTESLDRASQVAVESPAEILMMPENLSAESVGPRFFELFLKDFQTRWSRRIIEAGKFSCIHMDGTLAGLLRQESQVGLTFIEAMTPKPVGDLPVSAWAGYRGGSRTIYWGGIPGSYFTPAVSDREFDRHVREVLAVMRDDRRMVLGVADQVPPDGLEERVARVQDLVERYGTYR